MTQTIQIKRSTATAAPTSLQNGELAYSANSNKLFIGRPGGATGDVDVIGGKVYTDLIDSNSANWDAAYNDKINSASFDTGSGVLTLTQQDAGTVTVDLDGRYLQSYTEVDTLDSVTGRGATTTNSITVNGLTATGDAVIQGNLTVSGTTTTVNTEEVNIADNFVLLNSNFTGTASENAGIEIERGDDPNVQLRYNETSNVWEFTNDGTTFLPMTGRTDEEIADIAGALTTAGTKTNITVTYDDANDKIDYSVATATDSVLGVASFNSTEFTVTAGAVAITALDGGSF